MLKTDHSTNSILNHGIEKSDQNSLPCLLFSNNSIKTTPKIDENLLQSLAQKPESENQKNRVSENSGNNKLSSQQFKSAELLQMAVYELAKKYGISRLGFLTLTFKEFITDSKESQKRLNSLNTNILKNRYQANIRVFERCKSGRIHYHLIIVLPEDIRTGFNFEEIQQNNYRSANKYLRSEWAFWRKTSKKYGFGRTELLPIKSTSEAISKYVGKYISKNVQQRKPKDKGIRLVSYSKTARIGSTKYSFVTEGSKQWRYKVSNFAKIIGTRYGVNDLKYQDLKLFLGPKWAWANRDQIMDMPNKAISAKIKK